MSTNEPQTAYEMDPRLMTILSKKFEMVTRDMSQTLLKSARSGVISSARDFSSGITLFDGRQFMIDEGVPIHLGNIHLSPKATLDYFDDIAPGDCFLTNSSYDGNTHHADYTIYVPVFVDDEPLFWALNRAHQADAGAPVPSTYPPMSKNIYQEGPHFPVVRIQEEYEDREDIVRTCQTNIRAGDIQWYGDYRAQVASVRAGERGIQTLCEEYGTDTIQQFIDEWLQYGEEMMKAAIRDLPDTQISRTSAHDPIPNCAPDGVPVTVDISINPADEQINVDLTDNIENIPCGFNLSEATTIAAVYSGIFANLNPNIPHNHGAIKRINIEMEEGNVVGKPEFPTSTAVATTNVCAVLLNAIHAAFADLGEPYGLAEGNPGIWPHNAVISGQDARHDDRPYVNQIIIAAGGGPAVYGHDGWMAYTIPVAGGIIRRDSIEVDEQKYPLLFHRQELVPDTAGAGKWRGAPAYITEYEPRHSPMELNYVGSGSEFPPDGVRGGQEGAAAKTYKITPDGEHIDLPTIITGEVVIEPGEHVVGQNCGGGGYGNPLARDPHLVRADVKEGYITRDEARETYGVVFEEEGDDLILDESATEKLRNGGGD